MRYNRVICVGTIWDLDRVVYPELDNFSEQKMTRWNYVQIMGHQLCKNQNGKKNIPSRSTSDILGVGTSDLLPTVKDPW